MKPMCVFQSYLIFKALRIVSPGVNQMTLKAIRRWWSLPFPLLSDFIYLFIFFWAYVSWQCTISTWETGTMRLQAKSHMSHLENGNRAALEPRHLYLNGSFTVMENPAWCSENVGRKHKLGRLDTGGFPLWCVCPTHLLIHNLWGCIRVL